MALTTQPQLASNLLPPTRRRPIPSERNRRVWVEVVLAERPQPEVAKEFGITQQRISQIVDQFQLWLAENLPPGAEGMNAEQQLRLAANTAYLRQEHLYADAMRKTDRACEDKHSLRIRYSAGGEELWRETLRENQFGKSGYLGVALNAVTRQVKLVQMAAGLLGPVMEVFWDHGESVSREPDRFHCERSERIVYPAAGRAGQAGSASADPLERTPTGEACKPLCDSAPIEAADPPLAAGLAATTPVDMMACSDDAARKATPQESAEFCAKSCAAAVEDAGKVLCKLAAVDCEQKPLTIGDAAPNGQRAMTCEVANQRKPAAQEPCEFSQNSCEPRRRIAKGYAVDLCRDEPVLLSADDRRRRKHERQKQLVRWRASRQCVAG